MKKQAEETALLHQQASTKYLQGKFEQALEVWQKLLELDPQDERAQEGIRLCEMLTDEATGGEPAAPDHAAPPSPATPASSNPGGIDDLEDLLASEPQPPAAPATVSQEPPPPPAEAQAPDIQFDFTDLPDEVDLPDPDRQSDGIDVGDLDGMATIGLAAPGSASQSPPQPPAEPAGAEAVDIDFSEIDEKLGGGPSPPGPSAEAGAPAGADASASELSLRVQALYSDALAAHQEGNDEEALGILARLFILDENDAAAHELDEAIRARMSAAAPAPSPDAPTLEPPVAEELSAVEEPPAPQPADAEQPEETIQAVELDLDAIRTAPGGDAFVDALDDLAGDEPEAVESEAARRPSRPVAAPVRRRQPPVTKVLVGATIAIGAIVAGFYLVPRFLGETPAEPDVPAAAATSSAEKGGNDQPQPQATDAAPNGDAAETVAATLPPVPIDELLAQGRTAMDEQRYADAVLAYKRVLDTNPDHQQARQLLLQAGDLYHEQQQQLQKWQDSVADFRAGRYQEALKGFYRLTDEEDPARLERYKRNGWYNLGRRELDSGLCVEARSHFKEALGIDPDDAGARQGLGLCDSCALVRKEQSYYDAVAAMPERGLDD